MANCSACHKKADNGVFSKKTLEMPTYGAWRD
ncbi:MAG: diheme cytochrome c [Campylobacter sp.]|nr:diheme cytochrome c [Campylobacter sp.]MCI7549392.1 diheme cytochrome c [Campylobacter sp.]